MASRSSRLGDRLRRVEERRQILGRISETRLLKTAITGRVAAGVASSWIDMLAGLSIIYCRKIPPCFCADTGTAIAIAMITPAAAIKTRNFFAFASSSLCSSSF